MQATIRDGWGTTEKVENINLDKLIPSRQPSGACHDVCVMAGRKNIKGVVWDMLLWVEGGTIPDDSVVTEMPRPADTDSTTGKYLRKLMRKLECSHGGKKNCLEPFEILSHQEVKKELTIRKLNSMGDSKVVRRLAEHLGGMQRVPLLLVSNPQEHKGTTSRPLQP